MLVTWLLFQRYQKELLDLLSIQIELPRLNFVIRYQRYLNLRKDVRLRYNLIYSRATRDYVYRLAGKRGTRKKKKERMQN